MRRTATFLVLVFLVIATREADGKRGFRIRSSNRRRSNSSEDAAPSEPPPLPPPTQQDKDDADKIVKDRYAPKTIASILPYRTLVHRRVINEQCDAVHKGKRLIEHNFVPNHKKNPPFKDLCFALVNEPITVLAMYLGEFLHRRDETFVIIPLTLCQQIKHLRYIYDRTHKNGMSKRFKKQRKPFSNLLRAWLRLEDRESDHDCKFNPGDENKDAEDLKKEHKDWNENRDVIELVLIKKCTKFGAAVIKKFEDDLKTSIEKEIQEKIKNHDLVDAYTSLALYVKDRYNYMAKILLHHSKGKDRWAVWIMLIGFIADEDWPKIDEAFRKISDNKVRLTDFILNNPEHDKELLGVMAAMIDPKNKANDEPSAPNI